MLTYKSIYEDIKNFRTSAGTNRDNTFHNTDNPGRYFFKLFFYFDQGGLLDRRVYGGDYLDSPHERGMVFNNSALNYLMMNGEYERAELLEKFINLLSNINTHSPWYFSEIEGVADSINRKVFVEGDVKIDEARPTMTIKCLPDPVDDRIGTLMDLYKAVCYSYVQKKEIIPANLRKFTMGLYVFQAPKNIHRFSSGEYGTLEHNDSVFKTNTKYFEFINCEFLILSSATAYTVFNNKEGVEHNFEIGISYDDVYDERYNAFMLRTIGDFIKTDYQYLQNQSVIESIPQTNNDERNRSLINDNVKNPSTVSESKDMEDKNKLTEASMFETNKFGRNVDNSGLSSKTKLTETSMFETTKFGRNVKNSIKELNNQVSRLVDKYSPDALVGTATNYLVDKVDNIVMGMAQDVKDIVKGNLFYDDLGMGSSTIETLKEGNLLGTIESVVNGLKDNKGEETVSGWKKNLFK